MTPKDSVLRLVLVEDRVEDAEQIISLLRNGGMAVRAERAETEEQLQAALDARLADMVLVGSEAKALPMAKVAEVVHASGTDVPVLALVSEVSEGTLIDAFKAGVTRMAPRRLPAVMLAIIRSEFAAVESRRAVRGLQAALRESERRCDALIESSRDPIAYIHEGMHIRANQAYLEMFGFEEFEEVEGLSVLDLVAGKHADAFKQLLKRMSKGEPPPKTMDLTAQRSDGTSFDAVMEFAQATYEGERCLQIVIRQQLIDAEVVKELDTLRQRDSASGLFNRQHFLTELDETVAAAANGRKNQAVLLVDIDSYGALLNEIGLAQADELLSASARRLEAALGDGMLAARFADHGFGVLLRDSDYARTRETAEAIRAAFDGQILRVGDRSLAASVSIGGVQIGEKIASVPQVLGKSGQGLQAVGALGGNRIEVFDPAARDRAEEERIQAWLARINEALSQDQFVLNYQPIISLMGLPGECYEVLVRMQSPDGEIVSPEQFMPIAEEHSLLDDIDRWVIGRAISLLAERKRLGKDTTLFVKVTPSSLAETDLHNFISAQLKAHGISGENLVLQLPESKIFTHLRAVQAFQKIVGSFGIRLCLEQFGTSVDSLQMLNHFDPAILKIDRGFVADLAKNADNQKKVKQFVEHARGINKLTIAEFVSDAASMTVLFSMGVDWVQGNFLAPPGPAMNYDFG